MLLTVSCDNGSKEPTSGIFDGRTYVDKAFEPTELVFDAGHLTKSVAGRWSYYYSYKTADNILKLTLISSTSDGITKTVNEIIEEGRERAKELGLSDEEFEEELVWFLNFEVNCSYNYIEDEDNLILSRNYEDESWEERYTLKK